MNESELVRILGKVGEEVKPGSPLEEPVMARVRQLESPPVERGLLRGIGVWRPALATGVGAILLVTLVEIIHHRGNEPAAVGGIESSAIDNEQTAAPKSAQTKPQMDWEFMSSERVGFIDRSGKVVVPPIYAGADHFSEGLAAVTVEPVSDSGPFIGRYGFVDTSGRTVIEPRFEMAFHFTEGLAAVSIDGKWGFIDRKGGICVPPAYEQVFPFSEGLAQVEENGKWGFIDREGEIVVQPAYDLVGRYSEGMAPVAYKVEEEDGFAFLWGYIDVEGIVVIEPQFDVSVGFFSEGLAPVRKGDLWGYVDKTGETAIPFAFDSASEFQDGVAMVCMHGDVRVCYGIDRNGDIVILPVKRYDRGLRLSEDGRFLARYTNRETGEMVEEAFDFDNLTAPLDYYFSSSYASEGLIKFETETDDGTRYGFVSRNGEIVIPARAWHLNPFSEGLARFSQPAPQRVR